MGDVLPKSAAVLDTAKETICGPRQADYGHPRENLGDVAALWSAILPVSRPLTPRDVCKAMIAMKLSRDKTRNKFDNVVDIIGYAALIPEVEAPELDPDTAARIADVERHLE